MRFQRRTSSSNNTGDALGSIRREAAERAFESVGSSKKAAAVLVEAGFTTAAALVRTPWSAEEAGSEYESAEWRLRVRPGCNPSTLTEIRSLRDRLAAGEAGSLPA